MGAREDAPSMSSYIPYSSPLDLIRCVMRLVHITAITFARNMPVAENGACAASSFVFLFAESSTLPSFFGMMIDIGNRRTVRDGRLGLHAPRNLLRAWMVSSMSDRLCVVGQTADAARRNVGYRSQPGLRLALRIPYRLRSLCSNSITISFINASASSSRYM
nr:hypothetical protein CFP56_76309 [Quercus suber]